MIDRLPQTAGAAVGDIDPRTAFGSPEEIEQAEGLSPAEKERLLSRWAELSRRDGGASSADSADAVAADINTGAGRA